MHHGIYFKANELNLKFKLSGAFGHLGLVYVKNFNCCFLDWEFDPLALLQFIWQKNFYLTNFHFYPIIIFLSSI